VHLKQIFVIKFLILSILINACEAKGIPPDSGAKRNWPWGEYKKTNNLINGRIISSKNNIPEQLEINGPGYIPFLFFKNHEIKTPIVIFVGKIRCQGVKGTGFVEVKAKDMNGREYIQTAHGSGTKFQGDMDWTHLFVPFAMPLNMETGPKELQIAVYFPGAGKVFFTPLTEHQMDREAASSMVKKKEKRISDLYAYGWLIAGFFGICLFAVLLVKKRKAKATIFIFLFFTFLIGIILFISGILGFIRSHDWWVAGPIWFLGTVQMIVSVIFFFASKKYYK
jgi:hypothetical protein